MDSTLGNISVATPCTQSWDEMVGDEQVRHCAACDKNVYSLDTLSVDEVRALVVRTEGKICWRFFVRKDGTVLTRDCPVGLKRARQRARAVFATVAGLVLALAAGVLRTGGFWNGAIQLGSLSIRLGAEDPGAAALRANPPFGEGRVMGGKRMLPLEGDY